MAQMGVIVVPPLFGLLVDRSGSYQLAWLALGGFVLLTTLPAYRVARRA
ncbi:MAG: hypothetical protein JO247_20600 [Chloroflexi bacterium]|nr:hypothetical protein [Chloroflexota bacterium]